MDHGYALLEPIHGLCAREIPDAVCLMDPLKVVFRLFYENIMSDSKAIEILIAKNPNLKTFIEKFDLVLINTSKS